MHSECHEIISNIILKYGEEKQWKKAIFGLILMEDNDDDHQTKS